MINLKQEHPGWGAPVFIKVGKCNSCLTKNDKAFQLICSATKTNCLFMASYPFHTKDTGFTMPHNSEEPTAYYTLFIHFEGQRHPVTVYEIEIRVIAMIAKKTVI